MKQNLCCFVFIFQIMSVIATARLCKVSPQKDECGNLGWLWNCSDLNFRRIPPDFNTLLKGKAISIDLSKNNFTSISSKMFASINTTILRNVTALYMKKNDIKSIESFSFRRLSGLCVLDLSFCNLMVHTPRKSAFSHLGELKILYIQGNIFDKNLYNSSYPEGEISRLSSLRELHIDVFEGFRFRSSFERLKDLSKIKFYPTSSIFYLYNNTFSGLSQSPINNLKLNFRNHVRCNVSEDILCSFPYLRRIEMNFGGLCNLNVALKALKCLQNRTIVNISISSNVPNFNLRPLFLNKSNCRYLKNICVQKVDLHNNRIEGLFVDLIHTNFGRCIEHLDISQNKITHLDPSIVLSFVKNYPKLRFFDASFNNDNCMDESFNNMQMTRETTNVLLWNHSIWNPNITARMSKVLEVLRFSNNHMHDIDNSYHFLVNIVGETLKELDMSKTNLPCSRILHIQFPRLEILDISNNNCINFPRDIFNTLTNLKYFRASNINLGSTPSDNYKTLFHGLNNLHLLDLRTNSIRHLPYSFFRDQTKLKYLYLNDNALSSIPTSLAHLRKLKILNVQDNKIKSFKTSDFIVLLSLKNVKTFIRGNILDCDCSHISSLRQMKNNRDLFGDINETVCIEKSLNFFELLQVREFAVYDKKCQTGMWLICSSFMLFFVTIGMVVAIAIKRYRVHVDYIILRLRNRWKGVINADETDNFRFDAFILYSEDDYQLVTTTMYGTLKNLGFQISFPDKDFIPGILKAEQLVQCIDHSRKVVFVITENFLDSGWNSYAVQMAVTHAFHNNRKRSIVVIIKDNIPLERMPKDLRYIWWCIISMRWPEIEREQTMDIFWEEIAAVLQKL